MRILLDQASDDLLVETPLGFVHILISSNNSSQKNYIQVWPKDGVSERVGEKETILAEK